MFLLQPQPLLTRPRSPRENSITYSTGKCMQGNLFSNMAVAIIDNIKIFQSEPIVVSFFFFFSNTATRRFNGMCVEEMAFQLSGVPIFFAFSTGTWALHLINYGFLFDDMIIDMAKGCAFVKGS